MYGDGVPVNGKSWREARPGFRDPSLPVVETASFTRGGLDPVSVSRPPPASLLPSLGRRPAVVLKSVVGILPPGLHVKQGTKDTNPRGRKPASSTAAVNAGGWVEKDRTNVPFDLASVDAEARQLFPASRIAALRLDDALLPHTSADVSNGTDSDRLPSTLGRRGPSTHGTARYGGSSSTNLGMLAGGVDQDGDQEMGGGEDHSAATEAPQQQQDLVLEAWGRARSVDGWAWEDPRGNPIVPFLVSVLVAQVASSQTTVANITTKYDGLDTTLYVAVTEVGRTPETIETIEDFRSVLKIVVSGFHPMASMMGTSTFAEFIKEGEHLVFGTQQRLITFLTSLDSQLTTLEAEETTMRSFWVSLDAGLVVPLFTTEEARKMMMNEDHSRVAFGLYQQFMEYLGAHAEYLRLRNRALELKLNAADGTAASVRKLIQDPQPVGQSATASAFLSKLDEMRAVAEETSSMNEVVVQMKAVIATSIREAPAEVSQAFSVPAVQLDAFVRLLTQIADIKVLRAAVPSTAATVTPLTAPPAPPAAPESAAASSSGSSSGMVVVADEDPDDEKIRRAPVNLVKKRKQAKDPAVLSSELGMQRVRTIAAYATLERTTASYTESVESGSLVSSTEGRIDKTVLSLLSADEGVVATKEAIGKVSTERTKRNATTDALKASKKKLAEIRKEMNQAVKLLTISYLGFWASYHDLDNLGQKPDAAASADLPGVADILDLRASARGADTGIGRLLKSIEGARDEITKEGSSLAAMQDRLTRRKSELEKWNKANAKDVRAVESAAAKLAREAEKATKAEESSAAKLVREAEKATKAEESAAAKAAKAEESAAAKVADGAEKAKAKAEGTAAKVLFLSARTKDSGTKEMEKLETTVGVWNEKLASARTTVRGSNDAIRASYQLHNTSEELVGLVREALTKKAPRSALFDIDAMGRINGAVDAARGILTQSAGGEPPAFPVIGSIWETDQKLSDAETDFKRHTMDAANFQVGLRMLLKEQEWISGWTKDMESRLAAYDFVDWRSLSYTNADDATSVEIVTSPAADLRDLVKPVHEVNSKLYTTSFDQVHAKGGSASVDVLKGFYESLQTTQTAARFETIVRKIAAAQRWLSNEWTTSTNPIRIQLVRLEERSLLPTGQHDQMVDDLRRARLTFLNRMAELRVPTAYTDQFVVFLGTVVTRMDRFAPSDSPLGPQLLGGTDGAVTNAREVIAEFDLKYALPVYTQVNDAASMILSANSFVRRSIVTLEAMNTKWSEFQNRCTPSYDTLRTRKKEFARALAIRKAALSELVYTVYSPSGDTGGSSEPMDTEEGSITTSAYRTRFGGGDSDWKDTVSRASMFLETIKREDTVFQDDDLAHDSRKSFRACIQTARSCLDTVLGITRSLKETWEKSHVGPTNGDLEDINVVSQSVFLVVESLFKYANEELYSFDGTSRVVEDISLRVDRVFLQSKCTNNELTSHEVVQEDEYGREAMQVGRLPKLSDSVGTFNLLDDDADNKTVIEHMYDACDRSAAQMSLIWFDQQRLEESIRLRDIRITEGVLLNSQQRTRELLTLAHWTVERLIRLVNTGQTASSSSNIKWSVIEERVKAYRRSVGNMTRDLVTTRDIKEEMELCTNLREQATDADRCVGAKLSIGNAPAANPSEVVGTGDETGESLRSQAVIAALEAFAPDGSVSQADMGAMLQTLKDNAYIGPTAARRAMEESGAFDFTSFVRETREDYDDAETELTTVEKPSDFLMSTEMVTAYVDAVVNQRVRYILEMNSGSLHNVAAAHQVYKLTSERIYNALVLNSVGLVQLIRRVLCITLHIGMNGGVEGVDDTMLTELDDTRGNTLVPFVTFNQCFSISELVYGEGLPTEDSGEGEGLPTEDSGSSMDVDADEELSTLKDDALLLKEAEKERIDEFRKGAVTHNGVSALYGYMLLKGPLHAQQRLVFNVLNTVSKGERSVGSTIQEPALTKGSVAEDTLNSLRKIPSLFIDTARNTVNYQLIDEIVDKYGYERPGDVEGRHKANRPTSEGAILPSEDMKRRNDNVVYRDRMLDMLVGPGQTINIMGDEDDDDDAPVDKDTVDFIYRLVQSGSPRSKSGLLAAIDLEGEYDQAAFDTAATTAVKTFREEVELFWGDGIPSSEGGSVKPFSGKDLWFHLSELRTDAYLNAQELVEGELDTMGISFESTIMRDAVDTIAALGVQAGMATTTAIDSKETCQLSIEILKEQLTRSLFVNEGGGSAQNSGQATLQGDALMADNATSGLVYPPSSGTLVLPSGNQGDVEEEGEEEEGGIDTAEKKFKATWNRQREAGTLQSVDLEVYKSPLYILVNYLRQCEVTDPSNAKFVRVANMCRPTLSQFDAGYLHATSLAAALDTFITFQYIVCEVYNHTRTELDDEEGDEETLDHAARSMAVRARVENLYRRSEPSYEAFQRDILGKFDLSQTPDMLLTAMSILFGRKQGESGVVRPTQFLIRGYFGGVDKDLIVKLSSTRTVSNYYDRGGAGKESFDAARMNIDVLIQVEDRDAANYIPGSSAASWTRLYDDCVANLSSAMNLYSNVPRTPVQSLGETPTGPLTAMSFVFTGAHPMKITDKILGYVQGQLKVPTGSMSSTSLDIEGEQAAGIWTSFANQFANVLYSMGKKAKLTESVIKSVKDAVRTSFERTPQSTGLDDRAPVPPRPLYRISSAVPGITPLVVPASGTTDKTKKTNEVHSSPKEDVHLTLDWFMEPFDTRGEKRSFKAWEIRRRLEMVAYHVIGMVSTNGLSTDEDVGYVRHLLGWCIDNAMWLVEGSINEEHARFFDIGQSTKENLQEGLLRSLATLGKKERLRVFADLARNPVVGNVYLRSDENHLLHAFEGRL
jgi:hypothetical protein